MGTSPLKSNRAVNKYYNTVNITIQKNETWKVIEANWQPL